MDGPAIATTVMVLNLVMAAVYLLVGRAVMRRRPQGAGRGAATSFGVWWFALAGLQLGALLDFAITTFAAWPLAMLVAYTHFLLLDIVVALAALMYYLVYLYTGARGAWRGVAAGYGLYYVGILYYVAVARPSGVEETSLGSTLQYANDLSDTLFAQVLGILLIVPIMLAAVAYFSLYFKAPERSQRFRIAIVASALFIWFGSSLLAGETALADAPAWRIVAPVIALVASTCIYVAFVPPTWVRRRWGIHGYGEHAT